MPADRRLSLNQMTIEQVGMEESVRLCEQADISHIGLWRHKIDDVGLERASLLVKNAGLSVSSLCRGGFFPAANGDERLSRAEDNRAAVDEAAAVETDTLILVCGGMPPGTRDLDLAREMVAEGIAQLAPYATERGVRLAVEPLHPVFGADRSVIVTLGQALDVAEQFPADQVGVAIDTYHLWWDPAVWNEIERAGRRIFAFQVCDWLVPLPDPLHGRGMMGDGMIELRRFREAVDAAGYEGPVEVEIFNKELWERPAAEVVAEMVARFQTEVAPSPSPS